MDKAFENGMRNALIARRSKLVRTDDEIVKDAQGLQENDDVDEADHAQTAAAGEVIAHLDAKDTRMLGELDAALERLAEGRYGICDECEEEIPLGRLAVMPEARRCTECTEAAGRRDVA